MISLVWSRAFNFTDIDQDDFYAMVPLADYSNHQNIVLKDENERNIFNLPVPNPTPEFEFLLQMNEANDGNIYHRYYEL